jgi:hypothetical protein
LGSSVTTTVTVFDWASTGWAKAVPRRVAKKTALRVSGGVSSIKILPVPKLSDGVISNVTSAK